MLKVFLSIFKVLESQDGVVVLVLDLVLENPDSNPFSVTKRLG